ncbi:MAG: HAMP domain-containing histidine kinase [Flavobacteriales bacterium]|nr:HAMP domain-containing histidine kinase [Flavobacteriales bacterium]MCX7767799.1 HAMP domain-containing histidine kinase [Flavobacteriales bacterium]MDW8409800.1 HAMP domain-containing sensor histidine kinase [Flavobacteriales bacterium]
MEKLDKRAASEFAKLLRETLLESHADYELHIQIFDPENKELIFDNRTPAGPFKASLKASIRNRNFQKSGELVINYQYLTKRQIIQILLLIASLLIMIIIMLTTIYLINQQRHAQERHQIMTMNTLSNISHEIRSPITAISLACESLRKQLPNSKMLDIIEKENQRMSQLTEKVLENLKFQHSDKLMVQKEPIHVHELLSDIVQNIRMTILPSNTRLSLIISSPRDLVMGDKVLLTSVFYNLIENAVKYQDPAKPFHWIEVSTASRGNTLRISVKDNGVGIPGAYIKHVFDRFFRVPTNDIHNVKGHGLGLAFVKSVLESMDGHITVKSELGKETEFVVYLNLHPEKIPSKQKN